MRVLIVNTNRCRQPVAVLPFGACLVAQAARDAGHEVRLLDLMFESNPPSALREALRAFQPRAVGLSIRNIDTNDVRQPTALVDEAAGLVRLIRQTGPWPVILGGPALGVMPHQLLEHLAADYAVVGDGEAVLPDLLAALEGGEDVTGIEGVIVRGGPVPLRPRRGPLGSCEVRDFAAWLDLEAYRRQMASVPVQSKRGCPFSCVYCTYGLAEGTAYRLVEPAQVVQTVVRLARQGVGDVEFVDNVFNSPYEHAMAVCEGLAAARPGVRLQSLEINPRFLDTALLAAMRRAGFVAIGVTVESASDAVLARLDKGFLAADVHRAADAVARQDLPCVWIFMVGGPGETPRTLRQTLDFCRRCVRPSDTAFFNVGVRIYPGTGLEGLARQEGVLSLPPERMLEPAFYVSPQTPLPWLQEELSRAMARRLNFVTGDLLALPLLQRVLRLAHRLGVRPPLWRRTRHVRGMLRLLGMHP